MDYQRDPAKLLRMAHRADELKSEHFVGSGSILPVLRAQFEAERILESMRALEGSNRMLLPAPRDLLQFAACVCRLIESEISVHLWRGASQDRVPRPINVCNPPIVPVREISAVPSRKDAITASRGVTLYLDFETLMLHGMRELLEEYKHTELPIEVPNSRSMAFQMLIEADNVPIIAVTPEFATRHIISDFSPEGAMHPLLTMPLDEGAMVSVTAPVLEERADWAEYRRHPEYRPEPANIEPFFRQRFEQVRDFHIGRASNRNTKGFENVFDDVSQVELDAFHDYHRTYTRAANERVLGRIECEREIAISYLLSALNGKLMDQYNIFGVLDVAAQRLGERCKKLKDHLSVDEHREEFEKCSYIRKAIIENRSFLAAYLTR